MCVTRWNLAPFIHADQKGHKHRVEILKMQPGWREAFFSWSSQGGLLEEVTLEHSMKRSWYSGQEGRYHAVSEGRGAAVSTGPPPPLLEPKKEHKVRVRGGGCLLSA